MSKSTSRVWILSFKKVFTRLKLRAARNILDGSRTFGALMNRVTRQTIPSHSCAALTASSYSTMANAGGSYRSIGSTRTPTTQFPTNTFSGARRTHSLLLQICPAVPAKVVVYSGEEHRCGRFAEFG